MPYASNADLPAGVKNALPSSAQTTWRTIYNAAEKQYDDEARRNATAWAGLKKAGWEQAADNSWHKVAKTQSTLSIPIAKSDDQRQRVYGWASVVRKADGEEVVDLQGDIIAIEDLEEAMAEYVAESGELNFEHAGDARGRLIEAMVFTPEKLQQMGIPEGTVPHGAWVGYHIPNLADYTGAKEGGLLMFSIEGSAVREEVP